MTKSFLLKAHDLPYEFTGSFKFRISLMHLIDDEVSYLMKEQIFETQGVPSLIDGPPHDLSQHIIASFIRGQNSISDRESSRARVISDHAHGEAFLTFRFVISSGEPCGEIDDRANQICIVI